MNKKNLSMLLLLAGAMIVTACDNHDLYGGEDTPTEEKKVTDLVIPEDFDWNLITKAECRISATKEALISIYLNEDCSGDNLLATIPTVPNQTVSLPLNLPTYTEAIYIAYETAGGQQVVETVSLDENGSGDFTLPEDSRERAQRTLRDDNRVGEVLIPSGSWGTILFEDMFPSLGDYDFNDYVLKYQVSAQDLGFENGILTTSALRVGIRVAAIGGSLPYTPYLRISRLANKDVGGMDIYKTSSTTMVESDAIVWENRGDENAPVILNFAKVASLIDRPAGNPYFNTEKDYAQVNNDNYEAIIYLEEPLPLNALDSGNGLDYYLKNNDGTEIHLQGIQPVSFKYVFENNLDRNTYYRSDKGYVWALMIPADVRHVTEQTSFLSAYKDFERWVESGGKDAKDWYLKNMDPDLLLQ